MIVLDVLKASLKKIRKLESGRDILSVRQADALLNLQMMLRSWAMEKIFVFASTKESFSLVAAQAAYTWGASGNITTTRPNEILGVLIRDSNNVDYEVDIISESEYRELDVKTTSSRPDRVFFHPDYPKASLYFYPTPSAAETCYIDSLKPFTETSSFAAVSDTISFPPNYEETIVNSLSIRLAPEYEVSVPPELLAVTKEGYNALVKLNSYNRREPVQFVPKWK